MLDTFLSQADSQQLVKSFSQNIFKFLKIQLFTVNVNVKNKSCNYMMDIAKKVKLLNDIIIMLLKLRRNFIRFLNSNLKTKFKNGISDHFTLL